MTADSSTGNHSPHSPVISGDGVNSPHLQRRDLPSPWVQVVRGESEAISAASRSSSLLSSPIAAAAEQVSFSDCSALKSSSPVPSEETPSESSDSNNNNASLPKKPAWNKPLNGVNEVGPVMGAISWPALSECTRATPKSSSDCSKPMSDGSVSGHAISHSPQKQVNTNAKPNPTPNHPVPARQRSTKRGGGSTQNGFTWPLPPPPLPPGPPPPPFPLFGMPYGNLVPAMLDSSLREPRYKGNNWESRPLAGTGSQLHVANDQSSQRNSSRRGSFGSRSHGDGLYHNGYGGRRDHDRDWNARGSNLRDVHLAHQMAPPPPPPPGVLIRPPPPGSTPFISPQPMRPFGNTVVFDMASPFLYGPPLPPESFRGVPFVAHGPPPAMFFPVVDPSLPTLLVNQIDYYFSDANLMKDDFLKSNMDDQGWVPITLIASFPRVRHLTSNIQLILDSMRVSTVVEVQGDKLRRRDEWRKWIHTSVRFPSEPGLQSSSGSTDNTLASSLQKVSLG